jgi:hypothetical protein
MKVFWFWIDFILNSLTWNVIMCIFLCFAAEIHDSFPFIEIDSIRSAQEGQGEISEDNFFVFCHSYMYVLLSILNFFVMQNETSMTYAIKGKNLLGGHKSDKWLSNLLMWNFPTLMQCQNYSKYSYPTSPSSPNRYASHRRTKLKVMEDFVLWRVITNALNVVIGIRDSGSGEG